MNTKTIAALSALIIVLAAGYAVARPPDWNGMMGGYGQGNVITGGFGGMMNGIMGYGGGMMGSGRGMMGGAMMGYGGGMMSGNVCGAGESYAGTGYRTNTTPITIQDAKEAVEKYLASTGNSDLALTEVMEFDNHFYAEVKEKSTGTHAFELLVNRYTGAIFPEPGPNVMWNTRYGHMSRNAQPQATITEEQALKNAQEYLDGALPGTKAVEAETFPGYYTIHVDKDGKTYGMLSVNSNTGSVWYHSWHGNYVRTLEVE